MINFRKAFSLIGATTALTFTMTPLAGADIEPGGGAKDLLSDNVHNVAGGGANIHTTKQCVDKVGDKAHVKYMVQHQPLVKSSDHGQTSSSGTLAIPTAMENVKIRVKAVGYLPEDEDGDTRMPDGKPGNPFVKADVFDTPIDVPIKDGSDDEVSTLNFIKIPGKNGEESIKQNIKDGANMLRFPVADLRKNNASFDANFPFGTSGNSDPVWYGDNTEDYDFYQFGNLYMPITFEVEGDITTTGEDTFATAAISNLGWKGTQESTSGSYEEGAQNLMEYYWGRPGGLPPALPKDEQMIGAFKHGLSDAGLDISPYIAPTGEVYGDAKYRMIGSDIRPSARGGAGENYMRTFTLHANRAVTYIGQVPGRDEDGADITAAHVTICNKDKNKDAQADSVMPPEKKEQPTENKKPEKKEPNEQPAESKKPEKDTTQPSSTVKKKETAESTSTVTKDKPISSAANTTAPNTEKTTDSTAQNTNKDNINVTTSTQNSAPANGNGNKPQAGGEAASRNENSVLPTTGANLHWVGGIAAIAALAGAVLLLFARKKN